MMGKPRSWSRYVIRKSKEAAACVEEKEEDVRYHRTAEHNIIGGCENSSRTHCQSRHIKLKHCWHGSHTAPLSAHVTSSTASITTCPPRFELRDLPTQRCERHSSRFVWHLVTIGVAGATWTPQKICQSHPEIHHLKYKIHHS